MVKFNCEILRIVDADTFTVRFGEIITQIRLCCIDTEESFQIGIKPVTPAGIAAKNFAQWYWHGFESGAIAEFDCTEGTLQQCLSHFPDYFGRVVCHLYRSDGDFYSYRLLQDGWSPYFCKYGYSRLHHAKFQSVELYAKFLKIGIWGSFSDQSPRLDYPQLQSWWKLRADFLESFRAMDSEIFLENRSKKIFDGSCDNLCNFLRGAPGTLGGSYLELLVDFQHGIYRSFHSGAIFRCGSERSPLNLWFPDRNLIRYVLENFIGDFRQNYLYVRGYLHVRRGYMQVEVLEVAQSPNQFQNLLLEQSTAESRKSRNEALVAARAAAKRFVAKNKSPQST